MRFEMVRQLLSSLAVSIFLGLMPVGNADAASDEVVTGGRFILKTHLGEIVTDQDFTGKFMLIYFGYTYCPDICPTSLQTMTLALDLIGEDAKYVQPIFVTVDPERDTTAVMRDYVSAFHPSLIGLTGTKAALDSITKKYRIKYEKVADDGAINDDYLVDHTAAVLLMAPDGKYLTRFTYNTMAEAMAETLRKFINELIVK